MLTAISTAFHKGGWGMWPILFTSVVTIAIIVERAVYLFRASVDKDKLLALLKSQVMSGNVQGAIKVCSTLTSRSRPASALRSSRSRDSNSGMVCRSSIRSIFDDGIMRAAGPTAGQKVRTAGHVACTVVDQAAAAVSKNP